MSNDSMSWLAPVEMWTKSRLGYQQLLLIRCYVSGVATFTEVEEKERRHHTRCNVANRASRLFATLEHNKRLKSAVNDDCWTDEQWKQWKFAARFQVIEEMQLTKTRLERMNKDEKLSFNQSVQKELMRRLYADIMDSSIMQKQIITKL